MIMAVNLLTSYAKQIGERFVKQSLTKGRFSKEVSFKGIRTAQILCPTTVPVTDYKRNGANRYGEPQEMQDIIQEMTLSQDKSFSLTIDKGNNTDQGGLKAAGRMLDKQVREQCVPTMDKYMLGKLSREGGQIVGNSTKLTKNTIVERITQGTSALDDAEVPDENRTLFITPANYALLRLSPEFIGLEKIGTKSIAKGQIGEFNGMAVIKVPKGRWPENVNFMICHKDAATECVKISETHLHQDPPGISGNLLEGRYYYDIFVMMEKAAGIYVEVDTSSGAGKVSAAPTIAASGGAITGTGTVWHTTDGSDPRYSKSAVQGKTPAVTAAGTVVKAYQIEDGSFPSSVAVTVLTE